MQTMLKGEVSKMKDKYTVTLTRTETNWLHRQLQSGVDVTEGLMKQFTGPLSTDKNKELTELQVQRDELSRLAQVLSDMLANGERTRAKISYMREEYEEALLLNPEASVQIREELDVLPKEEPYRVGFNRHTLKMTLDLVNRDIVRYQTKTIKHYEESKDEEYVNPIFNKTYYVNKARKEKTILEELKKKLEREL